MHEQLDETIRPWPTVPSAPMSTQGELDRGLTALLLSKLYMVLNAYRLESSWQPLKFQICKKSHPTAQMLQQIHIQLEKCITRAQMPGLLSSPLKPFQFPYSTVLKRKESGLHLSVN